jgi:hypothetical protein
MAAGQGFKTFATGDVLTAADTNGYLMSQTVMVFADSTARAAAITSPQQGMISFLKGTNATEYYNGSAWTAIGGAGGGKVLQVVMGTSSTSTATTSTTYADTTLSATITPSASTSKVLVFTNQSVSSSRASSGDTQSYIQLLRGSTAIVTDPYGRVGAASVTELVGEVNFAYLDSPATTSSTTYKTQQKSGSVSHTTTTQKNSTPSSIILMEIGA